MKLLSFKGSFSYSCKPGFKLDISLCGTFEIEAKFILMVLDGAKEMDNQHRNILEHELETMGIRLNRRPADIYFRKKAGGGIKFNATVPLTKLGDDPADTVNRILHSYRIHHAHFLVREDVTVDEIIDCIEGNRVYIRCLYCYNKIDTLCLEEVDEVFSSHHYYSLGLFLSLLFYFSLSNLMFIMLTVIPVFSSFVHAFIAYTRS